MKTLVEDLLKNLNEREREVIKRRFGLENRESETLESIAKDFGITRERVRQIQNNALNKLIKIINENEKITNFVENTKSFLEPLGFKEENRFYKILIQEKVIFEDEINYLKLVLTYHQKIYYHQEEEEIRSFYSKEKELALFVKHILKKINIYFLENYDKTFEEKEIFNIINQELKTHFGEIKDEELYEVLRILKFVYRDPFGKWGFISNPFIAPQSLKNKIISILETERRPMHFLEIHRKLEEITKIEEEFLHLNWKKKYSVESIKNELIKHPDFVLVGRGIYALKKWGFVEGTSFELIKNFILSKKELELSELYEFIKNQRILKPTTFSIYLYRLQKEKFIEIKNGKIIVLKNA
jgi:hypothetical protein